jgi:DinB superfamily
VTSDDQHNEHCDSCRFTYDLTQARQAGREITLGAEQLATTIEGGHANLRRRPEPDTWSALEYSCHVRDVLLVQRERVLLALRTVQPSLVPMGRDERVEHDGYNEQSPSAVARQLRDVAALFAGVLDRLDDAGWSRTVIYNYPAPTVRDLAWLAVHTHHEVQHHLADVRSQINEQTED